MKQDDVETVAVAEMYPDATERKKRFAEWCDTMCPRRLVCANKGTQVSCFYNWLDIKLFVRNNRTYGQVYQDAYERVNAFCAWCNEHCDRVNCQIGCPIRQACTCGIGSYPKKVFAWLDLECPREPILECPQCGKIPEMGTTGPKCQLVCSCGMKGPEMWTREAATIEYNRHVAECKKECPSL